MPCKASLSSVLNCGWRASQAGYTDPVRFSKRLVVITPHDGSTVLALMTKSYAHARGIKCVGTFINLDTQPLVKVLT